MKKNLKSQKGFIAIIIWWVILIIIIAALVFPIIFIAMITGGPIRLLTQGEPGAWFQPGGALGASMVGTGQCKTTEAMTLEETTYRLYATEGGVSAESHLATTAETFRCGEFPCRDNSVSIYKQRDQVERHYQVTGMPDSYPKRPWTPPVGGGLTGQGFGKWGKPSPVQEPWIINMRWDGTYKQPPPNLKLLVCNPKNGKCFVAVGSFEKGPGRGESGGNIAGIQTEGLEHLDIEHGGTITVGYLSNQGVSGPSGGYGPVVCGGDEVAVNPNFIQPVGGIFGSPFGYRNDPFTGERRFHHGQDIKGNNSQPVKAANAGVVVRVQKSGSGYGNQVVINHGKIGGKQTYTQYAHLAEIYVTEGQKVPQGYTIGKVDSTGRSTGPHLHFEVRIGGNSSSNAVNPCTYISCENR